VPRLLERPFGDLLEDLGTLAPLCALAATDEGQLALPDPDVPSAGSSLLGVLGQGCVFS